MANIERALLEFLEDPERKDRLLDACESALTTKITEHFSWSMPDEISKVCTTFITDEVAPEVRAHLVSQKGPILAAAIRAADKIGDKLADKMVEKASKNMDGYNFDKLVEGMFK